MITVRNERIIMVDIDGTLVMHDKPLNALTTDIVIVNDYVSEGPITVWRNNPMIRLVQEEAARGAYLIAWSRGGFEWATAVLLALKLDKAVQQVITKPFAYFDDIDCAVWLKDRVYIEPGVSYKVKK